ncbi:MAG TPA: ABC transporter permease [Puia sp.]|nr:ABC transporter permease [Puia sp.]
MLRHYIRIAIRNLAKQKILTFINVSGLSLGLACFSLILLFAVSEFNFDKFNTRAGRIFRVAELATRDDGQQRGNAQLNVALAPTIKKTFPDVEEAVRISVADKKYLKSINGISSEKMLFADPAFFQVFSFPLIAGNPGAALAEPYGVVLTRTKAKQLFGTEDAVGKTLSIKTDSGFHPFTVTAVAADMPLNTSVSFDILGSYRFLEVSDSDRVKSSDNWHMTYGDQTFVLLRPGSRLPQQNKSLQAFRRQHFPEEGGGKGKEEAGGIGKKEGGGKTSIQYILQPLLSIHTDTSISDAGPITDPKNIYILLGIASGILLIASINFTTLAIARSAGRAREVGVRKVVGGRRRQLIGQFLTESVLLSIISTMVGCLLALLLLPWFSRLAGRPLEFSFGQFPQLAWMMAGLTVLVGLLAGFYPALVLSGFNTIEVLKAKIKLGGANLFTRSLVTLQFVLSIGLIIATTVMIRQVNFMRSKDLGLIKENVLMIHTEDIDAQSAYPLIRAVLVGDPAIRGISAASIGLGEGQGYMGGAYDFAGKRTSVIEYPVDEHFIPVMGMRLVAGRNFDRAITFDTVNNVIVNETLVHDDLGLTPEQAIGKEIKTAARPRSNARPQVKTIIGVVRDFNFERLNKKVRPQLFSMSANFNPAVLFVHLRAGDPTPVLNRIAAVWRRFSPDIPLNYSFLDEGLDRFYKSEARWGNIIACAGVISIFLACLGLFGLAALAAANRLKEIGIRRVLGASTATIVALLTTSFIKLVLVAAIIATPVAWVIMNRWLRDFAYRIDVSGWIFAVTALVALVIAFLTISIQALRAARANPVDNLRVE